MAARSSDVQLLIRARDESSKTLESISGALDRLFGAQEKVAGSAGKTSGGMSDLAKAVATLDKAYTTITGNATTAEAAFTRQSAAITGQRAALNALQQQAASAAAVLAKLNSPDAIVGAGRDQGGRLAQVKTVSLEYERLQGQIAKLATSIATQENALGNSVSSLQRIGSTANAVESAVAKARAQLEAETRSLDANTAAAAKNAAVKPRIEALTGVTGPRATDNGATFSALDAREASAFKAAAAAERDMAQAAGQLRAQLNPVADVEARLAVEQAKLNDLFRAGKISSTELSAGMGLLRGNADKVINALRGVGTNGKPQLFGLKPYELTNLGYQVNDVVTQLASGTSLTQTLAQQGGQILQLFPRVGAAVVAGLTSAPILAFTALMVGVGVVINRAVDNAEGLRKIDGILALNADGARYAATAIQATEKALDQFGLTADDALKVVRIALSNGLDQGQITTFGRAAKNLADLLGIDVVAAAQQLGSAFDGSFDGIKKLDDATNAYTASQLETIKALFEQGRAQEAVALASDIFSAKLEEAATKSRGPWADAARQLSTAWSGFLDVLSNSGPIQNAVNNLADLANAATDALRKISATGQEALNNEAVALEQQYARFLKFDQARKKYTVGDGTAPGSAQYAVLQGVAERLNAIETSRLAAAEKRAAAEKKASDAAKGTASQETVKAGKALTDEAQKRVDLEGKITNQAMLQARLARIRTDAILEAGKLQPKSTDADRKAFADEVVARKRVDLEKSLADYQKQQADEAERQARANNTVEARTKALLIGAEGFRSTAKYDRNAYRVGYGSDTTTAADGTVSRVTSTTTTTVAAATRDLERRIKEFSDTVKRQIGSERYGAFSPVQQAALNSIAYNYGSLPDRILGAVRTGSAAQIAAAVRGLGNDNGGINRGRRNKEAALIETPNLELAQSTATLEQDRLDVQKKFDAAIADENDKRRLTTLELQQQLGLGGEALIAAQRKQAVEEALLAKQQEFDRINAERTKRDLNPIDFTAEQRAEIEKTTGAYFDLAHAKDVAAAHHREVEEPVRDLTAKQDALRSQIDLAQQSGQSTTDLEATYKALTEQINAARDAQIALYEAIIAGGDKAAEQNGTTVAALEAQVASIKNAKTESRQLGTQFLLTGRQINQSIAAGATQAFDRFAQSVAEGKNVFTSLKESFLSFASDFLRQIALMIIQQLIFNAIGGSSGSGGGGAGGGIASIVGSLFGHGKLFHSGGIVGSGGADRAVNPSWFQNALTYHTGGVVGLAPDEIPAVLRRNEEVLTENDPRHRFNGGSAGQSAGGGGKGSVKLVNLFDPQEAIKQMLNTRDGEEALLNIVAGNPAAFKAALG